MESWLYLDLMPRVELSYVAVVNLPYFMWGDLQKQTKAYIFELIFR